MCTPTKSISHSIFESKRDTPEAKRQKRAEHGNESIPINLKIKAEPIDWEKVCRSISPSKIIKDEPHEESLIKAPPDGNETTLSIHIKKDLFDSDSESSDSETEEGEVTEDKEDLSPEPTSTMKNTELVDFKFTSHGAYQKETFKSFASEINSHFPVQKFIFGGKPKALDNVLCFRCKAFGHTRAVCKNNFCPFWPLSYVQRNPWIHEKFREIRRLGGPKALGRQELQLMDKNIEDEAVRREECRKRKVPVRQELLHQNKQPPRNNPDRLIRPPPPNRFEQPFPKVHRRLGKSPSTNSSSTSSGNGSPQSPKIHLAPVPNFDFLALIKSMQKQIEELQISCMRLQLQPIST